MTFSYFREIPVCLKLLSFFDIVNKLAAWNKVFHMQLSTAGLPESVFTLLPERHS